VSLNQSAGIHLTLSLASGLLLLLLFPPFGYSWLAPIALTPILIAIAREPLWKRRALYGWAAGFLFWAGLCPWIQFVLEVHGGMGRWGGWGSFLLFGLYKGLPMALFAALAGFLANRWWSIPASAALWTGLERLHGYTGFTWLDLGNAGIGMPYPMRLAPITGVYGLTFAFALIAAALASVILRRPRRELFWLAPLLLLPAFPRLPQPAEPQEQALVVQPNFDTEMDWTTEVKLLAEQQLALLSRVDPAKPSPPRLLIWPEAPAPFYPNEPLFRRYLARIAQSAQAHFLFGAVGFNPQHEPMNAAFLMDPSGAMQGEYDKINLVPFGEFIPPLFGFVNRITHEAGDFVPGNRLVNFNIDGHGLGAFICYEAVFPDFVRQFVQQGAQLLVNISNDGYFGHSAAHEQHLLIARMRAAENRRWLIRATNDGVTAVIDPRGRVVDRMPPFVETSQLMRFNYVTEQTLYTRFGDWFAWGCLTIGLLLAGLGFTRRKPAIAREPASH
jgi:apolipoprotein N-acyltransferase